MDTKIIPTTDTTIAIVHPFDALVKFTLRTISSKNSQRVYNQTYRAWQNWCSKHTLLPNGEIAPAKKKDVKLDPLADLKPNNVLDFLESQSTSKATRSRQLSAIRTLARMNAALRPNEAAPQALASAFQLIKPPAPDSNGHERAKRALNPAEADKLLRAWDGDTLQNKRNRALIAVLLQSGVRRSEAAVLRWDDVDFEHGVLYVGHGKGDKSREAPLSGDFALDALRTWQMCQDTGRQYVFCAVLKGNRFGEDAPITGTDVYRIVQKTEKLTGIVFRPHDCRRTFITEAGDTGTPTKTIQGIVGHVRAETTMGYMAKVDARRARGELRFRYG